MTATAEIELTLLNLLKNNWSLTGDLANDNVVFTRTDWRVESGIHTPRVIVGHGEGGVTQTREQEEIEEFVYNAVVRCVIWAETIEDLDSTRTNVWNMTKEVFRIIQDSALLPSDWDSMVFMGSRRGGRENELPSVIEETCLIKIMYQWKTA